MRKIRLAKTGKDIVQVDGIGWTEKSFIELQFAPFVLWGTLKQVFTRKG